MVSFLPQRFYFPLVQYGLSRRLLSALVSLSSVLPRSLNKMLGAGDSMGVTLASEDPALARGAS